MRLSRWIRGDWQILGWLQKRVLDRHKEKRENPLNKLSKYRELKCPYCGSAGGVCNEFKVSGIDYYRFDGSIDGKEITGPYEHTKYVECIDCGKRIMTYEEFVENYI